MTNVSKNSRINKNDYELLQLIIDNITYLVFWKDKSLKFLGCNQRFADAMGIDNPENIIGRTDDDILTDKEDAQKFREVDQRVIETGEPASYKMKTINNENKWLDVTKLPLRDKSGNIIGIIGIIRDITEQINMQEKIITNGEKYRNLIELTDTAYAILDRSLHIVETNDVFNDLLGTKIENLKGKSLRCFISGKDICKFDEATDELLNGALINNLEIILRTPKKELVAVSLNANMIENGTYKIICLLRNISKKRGAEIREYIKEQKQKDKLKQSISSLRGLFKKIQTKEMKI